MKSAKRGLLLLNLGTPDAPEPEAVGRYLKQFLMDKWVVDIPWVVRWFLVNVIIVPRRKYTSAEAYKLVWGESGSPLLKHLKDLAELVRKKIDAERQVEIGMRYGNPSIASALKKFQESGVEEITVFPLYPQYAESTTRSSIEECQRVAKELGITTRLEFVKPFYRDTDYIDSLLATIQPVWSDEKPEHLLMTFHGLPERHVKRTDRSQGQHCLVKKECCSEICDANRDCYRAHCFATAQAVAQKLGLQASEWSISFQSRLGKDPWIQPYTEEHIHALAKRGIRNLAVTCPSFVSDCLETIEEIGERGSEEFHKYGGQTYTLIPCMNSSPKWVETVVKLAR